MLLILCFMWHILLFCVAASVKFLLFCGTARNFGQFVFNLLVQLNRSSGKILGLVLISLFTKVWQSLCQSNYLTMIALADFFINFLYVGGNWSKVGWPTRGLKNRQVNARWDIWGNCQREDKNSHVKTYCLGIKVPRSHKKSCALAKESEKRFK